MDLKKKVNSKFVAPKRGDIVVFRYPDDPTRNFVSRIIGIGGDTIEIRLVGQRSGAKHVNSVVRVV